MTIDQILTKCCSCEKVRMDENRWAYLPDTYFTRQYQYSHGYCPKCLEIALKEVDQLDDHSYVSKEAKKDE